MAALGTLRPAVSASMTVTWSEETIQGAPEPWLPDSLYPFHAGSSDAHEKEISYVRLPSTTLSEMPRIVNCCMSCHAPGEKRSVAGVNWTLASSTAVSPSLNDLACGVTVTVPRGSAASTRPTAVGMRFSPV